MWQAVGKDTGKVYFEGSRPDVNKQVIELSRKQHHADLSKKHHATFVYIDFPETLIIQRVRAHE